MTKPDTPPSPAASDIDEGLHDFWRKNSRPILLFCVLVLLGYLGKTGWEYFGRSREQGIEQEYAAANSPEKLQAFADAHPDHRLAGVAELRLGDQAYASDRMPGAIAAYGRAVEILKSGPLADRARLGLAMAEVQSGRMTDGEGTLHRLAEDPAEYRPIRAEATYQLASLASSSGRAEEVRKYSVQLMQIDPNSPWTQRAFALEAALSPPSSSPASNTTPGISFKPGS